MSPPRRELSKRIGPYPLIFSFCCLYLQSKNASLAGQSFTGKNSLRPEPGPLFGGKFDWVIYRVVDRWGVKSPVRLFYAPLGLFCVCVVVEGGVCVGILYRYCWKVKCFWRCISKTGHTHTQLVMAYNIKQGTTHISQFSRRLPFKNGGERKATKQVDVNVF